MKHPIKWMDYLLIKGGKYLINQILHNIKTYITEEKAQFLDNSECNNIINELNILFGSEVSHLTNFEEIDLYET